MQHKHGVCGQWLGQSWGSREQAASMGPRAGLAPRPYVTLQTDI